MFLDNETKFLLGVKRKCNMVDNLLQRNCDLNFVQICKNFKINFWCVYRYTELSWLFILLTEESVLYSHLRITSKWSKS